VTPLELSKRLSKGDKLPLLDVRELNEHQFVSLPDSIHIPLGELPERVGELEALQAQECVVYCHHGIRSLHAIGYLRQCGFEKLHNLTGGIDLWSLEVDPGAPRY
jgi:rhodanese-related sulfurtransferase